MFPMALGPKTWRSSRTISCFWQSSIDQRKVAALLEICTRSKGKICWRSGQELAWANWEKSNLIDCQIWIWRITPNNSTDWKSTSNRKTKILKNSYQLMHLTRSIVSRSRFYPPSYSFLSMTSFGRRKKSPRKNSTMMANPRKKRRRNLKKLR